MGFTVGHGGFAIVVGLGVEIGVVSLGATARALMA